MRRTFTLQQAERLLPFVKQSVARIVMWRAELDRLVGEQDVDSILELPQALRGPVGDGIQQIQRELATLRKAGVVVKDLDRGIVDFRASRGGRDILLCWQLGEEHIAWWHEVSDGYSERKRLDDTRPLLTTEPN